MANLMDRMVRAARLDVQLYEEGRLDLDGLDSQVMRMEVINTAVENVLAGNRVARQVIRFD